MTEPDLEERAGPDAALALVVIAVLLLIAGAVMVGSGATFWGIVVALVAVFGILTGTTYYFRVARRLPRNEGADSQRVHEP